MTFDWQQILDTRTVYEDEHMLVLDKPEGLAVQPRRNGEGPSVSEFTKAQPTFLAPANRLDVDTSGLLLMGKSPEVTGRLQTQLGELQGGPVKTYLAVVDTHNALGPEFDSLLDMALIDLPIKSVSGGTFGVPDWQSVHRNDSAKHYEPGKARFSANAKQALTSYGVVLSEGSRAVVALQLITGRTHQLRVHMRSIQHPIVGDPIYAPASDAERMHLHSWRVRLRHPITNEPLQVTAPPHPSFWTPLDQTVEPKEVSRRASSVSNRVMGFTDKLGLVLESRQDRIAPTPQP